MQRSRNWCYTLNHYNDEQLERLLGLPEFLDYLCFGKEVGGTEGTPHLQGFCRSKNRMSCSAFREAFGIPETHIEPSKGTAAQGIAYCEKDGSFFEVGTRPLGQGKRSDLDRVCERIRAGDGPLEACDDDPTVFVKYHRGLQAYQEAQISPRSTPVRVIWCWGATGTGKTRWCFEQAPLAYWKEPGHKWWCNYAHQDAVIIDDWRPTKELPLNYLLRLFDRYPMQVESKGGNYVMTSTLFYVTSPRRPDDMLRDIDWLGEEKILQLMRRISEIKHFDNLITI